MIGAFAGRHDQTFPLMHRVLVSSTRKPEEFWVVCESDEDVLHVDQALHELRKLGLGDERTAKSLRIELLPTPMTGGRYDVIPYSNKINHALDRSEADLFVYLDNGSWPAPEKYELMARALENKYRDLVYCGQKRTGYREETHNPTGVLDSGFCVLNFTQVMHRRVESRWTLDMQWADPDLADAFFWLDIREEFGTPFYPAAPGVVLDEHHMPSPAAQLS